MGLISHQQGKWICLFLTDGLKGLGTAEWHCLGSRAGSLGSGWAAATSSSSRQALGDDTQVSQETPGRARRDWGKEKEGESPGPSPHLSRCPES